MALRYGMPLRVEEVKATGDDWEVSGYASTFGNVDLGGDIVVEGAFKRSLKDTPQPKFLHSHDPRMVLGVTKSLREDSKGLLGTWKISRTQLGEDTHTLLKDGAIDAFSIGYIPRVWEWRSADDKSGNEIRVLKDVDLLEVSLVAMPMNPEARLTRVKGLTLTQQSASIRDDLDELEQELKALCAKQHPLTDSKRAELTALLSTFEGVDAVRQSIDLLLNEVPDKDAGASVNLRLAIARRRLRHAGILEG